ncbi:MAG TPA: UDP-N-acetylglucosamine 4,6-dehydratase (inverting) [Chlamydiales bacterium]|nr:UDP-N-acetylglucosamine 4,6-dehydratase (inverting) [Chlamydiales bacterium]
MSNDEIFRGKTVLITGGTGTFGHAFAGTLLEKDLIQKVIIFSRDEWKQWEMREANPLFKSQKARFFLGDVRDEERLKRAFNEVNFVVHAAALKQVPAAEYNPSEFVKTNINGAMHVINAAIEAGVEKVVALSSDKAVNPINLYGATKLCSDKLFLAAKSYVGKKGSPRFSIVRYGNVLGSRGSLLPFWKKLIADGAKSLPVTDIEMTRFWITIPQAVNFVMKALERMHGSEIFVPKSPSVKITDLAKALAPALSHQLIGVRPGEKIHEVLISPDDAYSTYELNDCYLLTPTSEAVKKEAKKVEAHFCLQSNINPLFMSDVAAISQLLKEYK